MRDAGKPPEHVPAQIMHMADWWWMLRNSELVELIGDAERGKVLDKLSDAYVAGFLTKAEFDERSEMVQAARYEHQLDWPLRHLPARIPRPVPVPKLKPPEPAKPGTDWGFICGVIIGVIGLVAMLVLVILVS